MQDLERKILLNPGPGTTSQNTKEALVVNDICPREGEFGAIMNEIVDGLLAIGNGQDDYEACLFAASGTGAVEAILTSALDASKKVLIVTNGAYGIRMRQICESYQLPHETIHEFGDYPDVKAIRQRLQEGDFTHLAVIHHETSTGMMNPLEEFCELCDELDITLIVDAMSSYGAYPMDLKKLNIDYLAASSNKCIHGVAGLSFVIFNKEQIQSLKKSSGSFYFDLYKQWKYLKESNQLRFTPPVQVCYAFKQAIEETLKETTEKRWERYQRNWQILYDGLKELGFEFYLPDEQQSKILIAVKRTGILPKGFDHFHDALYERNITVYPGVIPETDTFRMAVIGDLFEEDLKYVIAEIRSYLKK
ncbi:2-aminoethylphosphonate aminotransferase [Gracilimonas sediminicola]|uniref:2-aminoethylphosphonate--pyruvate transaminase n=1 Tax=Gracilimonas sediminicola TaxID=2952158 RepID=A0A9X2L2J5_9BACT|nr:2-aminoethylphosphonate--pyruvate transaminase [Gracilimonas sediminicola]MCP9291158.1 2-aminoethylphosphonate--pyruvate transaminase [Gracilimonas sediminicola]